MAEIVAIPPGICPGLDDHYAMTTAAVRALLVNERNKEAEHAAELVTCSGAALVAEIRQKQAEMALEHADWWRRYGPIVGVSSFVLGVLAGVAASRIRWIECPEWLPLQLCGGGL